MGGPAGSPAAGGEVGEPAGGGVTGGVLAEPEQPAMARERRNGPRSLIGRRYTAPER